MEEEEKKRGGERGMAEFARDVLEAIGGGELSEVGLLMGQLLRREPKDIKELVADLARVRMTDRSWWI